MKRHTGAHQSWSIDTVLDPLTLTDAGTNGHRRVPACRGRGDMDSPGSWIHVCARFVHDERTRMGHNRAGHGGRRCTPGRPRYKTPLSGRVARAGLRPPESPYRATQHLKVGPKNLGHLGNAHHPAAVAEYNVRLSSPASS